MCARARRMSVEIQTVRILRLINSLITDSILQSSRGNKKKKDLKKVQA